LVNQAFAGPDYEAEFTNLKQQMVDNELDIDTKKQQILNQGIRYTICVYHLMLLFSKTWMG
jgi:hypothetical protein